MDDETRAALASIEGELRDFRSSTAARFDAIDGRFRGVDARLDAMDARFDTIDGRLDSIDGRLDSIDARFDAVDRRLEAQDRKIEAEGDRTRRETAILVEQLRHEVQVVAEGVVMAGQARERLEQRLTARIVQTEAVVLAAIGSLRRDLDAHRRSN